MTTEVGRMRDGPPVTDLVTRASDGDKQAWDALVERYIPLVWSICRRRQLNSADAREVSQAVWRQLAVQLGTLRNPTAVAGWLASTTQRECDRAQGTAQSPPGPEQMTEAATTPDEQTRITQQELLMAECHALLREGFAHLPPHCRRLIAMLIQDPPVPDAEISAKLGIPARSIRQNCSGCLQRLRRYPAIAILIQGEAKNRGSGTSGQAAALLSQSL